MPRKILTVCLLAAITAGCSSVTVTKNPDDGDLGFRFYRPKPYLLVTPADPTGRLVNLKLEYLPDLNEQYSARVRGKASLALKDGWNVIGVNTKEAAKSDPPATAPIAPLPLPEMVVAASNIPIGYYEAIYDTNGTERILRGWRYVGFTPLGGGRPSGRCPTDPPCSGAPGMGCDDPLYGIVFFNGAMTFRQLGEIGANQLCPTYIDPAPQRKPVVVPVVPVPDRTPAIDQPKEPARAPAIDSTPAVPLPTPAPPAPAPAPPAPTTGSLNGSKPALEVSLMPPVTNNVGALKPATSGAPLQPAATRGPRLKPATWTDVSVTTTAAARPASKPASKPAVKPAVKPIKPVEKIDLDLPLLPPLR